MKRLVLLLFILLSASVAYGQQHGRGGSGSHRSGTVQRESRHHEGHLSGGHHSNNNHSLSPAHHSAHHNGGHHGSAIRHHSNPPRPAAHHVSHGHHHRPAVRREIVLCRNDRQRLWNGYHVRVFVDRVWVCNAAGDRLLQGDEVILLPNGYYKVRNGAFWRVYTPRGESVFELWGDEVELLPDGLFRCYRAGMYFYYDELGNRVQ